jgi:hypothetical protein
MGHLLDEDQSKLFGRLIRVKKLLCAFRSHGTKPPSFYYVSNRERWRRWQRIGMN